MNTPRKLKLLMAEDDPDDRLLLEEAMFEVEGGHEIDFAPDGEAILELLRSGAPTPDLVLLDLNMPRMNGFEALEEIRRDAVLRILPVVVLTTSTASDDIVKAYRLGASAFLSKPESFRGLVELLRCLTHYWSTAVHLP